LGSLGIQSGEGGTSKLIRYALEISDPHLAQVVRRVEADEMTIEHLHPE